MKKKLMSSPIDRFMAKFIALENGCWQWIAGITYGGWSYKWSKAHYGSFWVDGRSVRAHRWAFSHYRPAKRQDQDLDHRCNFSLCVNPWHLEPTSKSKNTARARRKKLDKKAGQA